MSSSEHHLPPDICARLDAEQRQRLGALMAQPSATHSISYQASSNWFGQKFYVAFFMGREQRSPGRLEAEGQRRFFGSILFDASVIAIFLVLTLIFLTGLAVTITYLLKSAAGIDLFDGHFILHSLFF